jgi:hypothetical protein
LDVSTAQHTSPSVMGERLSLRRDGWKPRGPATSRLLGQPVLK